MLPSVSGLDLGVNILYIYIYLSLSPDLSSDFTLESQRVTEVDMVTLSLEPWSENGPGPFLLP